MCDQTIPYSPGTLVWVKTYSRLWWPGRVVDPTTVPLDVKDFIKRKKNPIAVVHFEKDDQYDIVDNMDKVFLYACPKKLEFLEKGYSMYVKQKNGMQTSNVDMNSFIEDVVKFETEIHGDKKIFEQFDNKQDALAPRRELIKELFTSSKDSKKKEVVQKPLLNYKPTVKRHLPSSIQSKYKSYVSATQTSGSCSGGFTCHLKKSCNFQCTHYEALKRHMAVCRTIVEDTSTPKNKTKKGINTKTLFQTQNKRKSSINKKPTKKTKIHVELLKDWEDDEDDQDDNNTLNHHAESGISNEQTKLKTIFDFDEIKGNDDNVTTDTIDTEEKKETTEIQGTTKKVDNPKKPMCGLLREELHRQINN